MVCDSQFENKSQTQLQDTNEEHINSIIHGKDIGMPAELMSDRVAELPDEFAAAAAAHDVVQRKPAAAPAAVATAAPRTGFTPRVGAWMQQRGGAKVYTTKLEPTEDGGVVGTFGTQELRIDSLSADDLHHLEHMPGLTQAVGGRTLFVGEWAGQKVQVKVKKDRPYNGSTGYIVITTVNGSQKSLIPIKTEEQRQSCNELAVGLAKDLCAGRIKDLDQLKKRSRDAASRT